MQRPRATKPKFEAVTPRLPVSDMNEALTFYCEQLGFQIGWQWGNPVTHTNVCRDIISLDLVVSPPGRRGPAMVYIQLSGVDAYFAELLERTVSVGELENRAYGMRDFEVVDPAGNRLAFGEPLVN
jgi:catechol 2,3-dioxygenase-like lactoylglutathione lyase family enzyme